MDRSLNAFLDRLTARTRLTEGERHAVLSLVGRAERLEAHEACVVIGDAITSVTLLLEGICARVDMPSEERRQITAIYIKGDMFDLGGIFEPQATATVEALTDASIVRITHSDMRALMRTYPAISEAFSRYLLGDAAITAEWLINIGGREARATLAHLFCEMAVRLGRVDGNSFSFHFPMSQLQLSEATGLSAVHVNRSLGCLRQNGLMRISHGMVQVPDWGALKRAAHFNGRYLVPEAARRFAA